MSTNSSYFYIITGEYYEYIFRDYFLEILGQRWTAIRVDELKTLKFI